jgi:hypothetical protein
VDRLALYANGHQDVADVCAGGRTAGDRSPAGAWSPPDRFRGRSRLYRPSTRSARGRTPCHPGAGLPVEALTVVGTSALTVAQRVAARPMPPPPFGRGPADRCRLRQRPAGAGPAPAVHDRRVCTSPKTSLSSLTTTSTSRLPPTSRCPRYVGRATGSDAGQRNCCTTRRTTASRRAPADSAPSRVGHARFHATTTLTGRRTDRLATRLGPEKISNRLEVDLPLRCWWNPSSG